jgi:succinate dehydrogenase/fumarate reductase flavoprotein subunit
MYSTQDRRSRLKLEADVLVVGGGAAGLAAACTAAEQGLRVILLERYGFCGGGAVAGLSGTICGMYAATDDSTAAPRKVVFGFLDTFVKEMEERGGLAAPVKYGKTYIRSFGGRPRTRC